MPLYTNGLTPEKEKELEEIRKLRERWETKEGKLFREKIIEQLQCSETGNRVEWQNLFIEIKDKKIAWKDFEKVNEIKRTILDATYDDKKLLKDNNQWGDLRGINLRKLDLRKAKFSFCHMDGVDFSNTDLRNAEFVWTNLKWSLFNFSKLQSTHFDLSNLENASFNSSNLNFSSLSHANLQNADLTLAQMKDVNLTGAKLGEASLNNTNLNKAIVRSSNLEKAHLSNTFVKGTDFSYSNFKNAFWADLQIQHKNSYHRLIEVKNYCISNNFKKMKNPLILLYFIIACIFLIFLRLFKKVINDIDYISEPTKFYRTRLQGAELFGAPVLKRNLLDEQYLDDFSEKHPLLYIFWLITSNCGRSISLLFSWSLIISICFGLIYANFQCPYWFPSFLQKALACIDPQFEGLIVTSPWWKPFYMSFVTMTTLGWSSVEPANTAGFWWHTAQNLFGYIWLGYLIAVLGDKLTRRST